VSRALPLVAGGIAGAAVAAAFAAYGGGEPGLVHATRYTARVSSAVALRVAAARAKGAVAL
jgi:NaMN:DMB phosphoribosyltransferase